MFTDKFNKTHFFALLVALATISVYLPALHNGFVNWDDKTYVYDNVHIQNLNIGFLKWAFYEFYAANWHPLTWLSHALDFAIWKGNPAGHHLTSIILHGVNTLLVVLLCIRLTEAADKASMTKQALCDSHYSEGDKLTIGVVAGLLFGLHPLHVESVAWVSERKDVLCALFFLMSLLAYSRYRENFQNTVKNSDVLNISYLRSIGYFTLALLSKPMAITLPIVLLLMDWYPFNRFNDKGSAKSILLEKLPFFALSLFSAILTVVAQQSGEAIKSFVQFPLSMRILVSVNALVSYLYKMLWPDTLIPLYPYPRHVSLLSYEYAIPVILVLAITIICFILARRHKVWMAIWGYYLITLLPVIGIIQVGIQSMADRYTYLPSIGPFMLTGIGTVIFLKKKNAEISQWIKIVLLCSVLLIFSLLTIKQIHIWESGITLWSSEILYFSERNPKDYNFLERIYDNRGLSYGIEKRYREAASDETKAIEINPNYVNAYLNRGVFYSKLGLFEDALKDVNEAIRLQPNSPELYYNRGNTYAKLGRLKEAINDYTSAIILSPKPHKEIYYNRSITYKKMGLSKAAKDDLLQFEKIKNQINETMFTPLRNE